jgi:hypothetical protein
MNEKPSGWAIGWAYFAAFMLLVGGMFQAVIGLAGVFEDEFYVSTRHWLFSFDATAWGWVHLLLGVVLFLAGIGIVVGSLPARIVAVVVAGLSAVATFAFLPWYPIWAVIVITVDLAVIWSLTAHGHDIEATS